MMTTRCTTTALVLVINLFFVGFTVAQASEPQVSVCPRNSTQACYNRLHLKA
ncbi:hypothetical protein YC2023_024939 [Brassica napus]